MLVEDTFIEALFKTPTLTQPNHTRAHRKRRYSSHPSKAINKEPASKMESIHEEKAKKASIVNEEKR